MEEEQEAVIPLVEERIVVDKRTVDKAAVRVHTHTERHIDIARATLEHEEVEISRVAKDEEVASLPPVRTEGNVTIVPVVEERLVVTKRLVLVEEIHLKKIYRAQEFTQP